MSTGNTSYLDHLRTALRARNVSDYQAEQIISEVRAHQADTGEDPVNAFGPAQVYAAQYGSNSETPASTTTLSAQPKAKGWAGWPTWGKVTLSIAVILAITVITLAVLTLLGTVHLFNIGRDAYTQETERVEEFFDRQRDRMFEQDDVQIDQQNQRMEQEKERMEQEKESMREDMGNMGGILIPNQPGPIPHSTTFTTITTVPSAP